MTPGRGSHPPLADEEHQLEAYPVHPPSTAVSTISSSLTHTFEAHSESQKPLGYSSIVYPSRKDRFGNGPDRNWWWVAKVILRSFSLTFAAILIVVEIYVLYDTPSEIRDASSASAIWSVSAFSLLWDAAEFVAICARRGYGLTPKAHIWVELVLWIFCGASTAGVWLQTEARFDGTDLQQKHRPALTYVLCSFAIIATLHFTLFIRAILDTKLGIGVTPRVMYLPSGQPVVVVERRPVPPPPSKARQKPLSISTSSIPPSSSQRERPSLEIRTDTEIEVISPTSSHGPPISPVVDTERPRIKPAMASGALQESSEVAPGPDYQPDEAERERAARGEAQAQWMMMGETDTTHSRRGDRPAEKFLAEGPRKKPQRRNST